MPRRSPSHLTTIFPLTHHLLLLTVVMMFEGADIAASIAHKYNPCNNSPSDLESQGHRDMIPSSFTVQRDCMRAFIDELCKDNLLDVNPEEIGPGKQYNRGIPGCTGANCSIECIHYTFCDRPLQELQMPQESVPQQAVGHLPEMVNAVPVCNKYLGGIDKSAIQRAGHSCLAKLWCTCGMCCESSDQDCFTNPGQLLTPYYHHRKHHHYPLLRPPPPLPPPVGLRNKLQALLRLLPRINLSDTKRMTVMTMMLDRTYKDLQAHLNSQRSRRRYNRPSVRVGHGTLPKTRVAAYPQRIPH